LNHRSVAGVRAEDHKALRAAIDRVSVNDALAAIEWIAASSPDRSFDRGRIATLGRGFGGYLALRSLQLHPAVFRCGIAVDAPLELRSWLRRETPGPGPATTAAPDIPAEFVDHEGVNWKALSVLAQAEALANPVLLLVEPGRSGAIDAATGELRARLQGLGRTPEYVELDSGFAAAQPKSRAAVYQKIHDFLNLRLPAEAGQSGLTEDAR